MQSIKSERGKLTIVFFGNTKYSLIGAKIIQQSLGLSCIVTIPNRPDKRGRLLPSPLKNFALEKNIPVVTVDTLDEETLERLKLLKPDFFVVEDYGLFLPDNFLTLPKLASINIHHSLLPKYRGPSPAPNAILNGDRISGVTVMKMVAEVDAGPILAQKEYTLKPDETTDSLLTTLNKQGAELLIEVLKDYKNYTPQPQDEKKATLTERLKKVDGYFDIDKPPSPQQLDRMIRAYYPWPNAWTKIRIMNHELRIMKLLPQNMIQLEGGKPMSIKDFLNGYPEMKDVLERIF